MFYKMTIYLFVFISFASVKSARILAYFPTPSLSHHLVFRQLTLELARVGHDVTVIATDPVYKKNKSKPNYTEIDVHDVSYKMWTKMFSDNQNGDATNVMNLVAASYKKMVDVVETQISTSEVQSLISSRTTFDLVITEAWPRPALIISHYFKAPLILFSSLASSFPLKQVFGAPYHPLFYPEVIATRIYNLTLIEKLKALVIDSELHKFVRETDVLANDMFSRLIGNNAPTVDILSEDVDILFLNVNPIWEGNHPYPPNVIHVGGVHVKPATDLPIDLKAYLDSSKNGVIYMSFGTNVSPSLLPPERIQIFNKVFSKLPYDVLWKWDTDDMPGKADNVKVFKWLPQSDLLRHPKINLFITQCGLQSTDESITAGVPLIGFPMLGDQWYNAEKYVYHKIGLKMDFETLTEEKLESSIKKVIEDNSYRENVVRLRTLMNDQPQTPLERAVWWTEYVIRHKGAKHLKSPMANISWAEYLVLDVLLLVLGVGLVILLIGSFVLYKLVKLLGNLGSPKSKLKSN